MPKLLFIVLDGLGDRPVKEFGNKTPLEAAKTPALDKLAAMGTSGMLSVIPGVAPESDAAVIALLGYNPKKYYTGRGPLEGKGIGADFKEGMLALRCNFATTSDGKNLVDRRVARTLTSREASAIAKAINRKVKLTDASFKFYASVAHRAVLVIKAKKCLSANISNIDPAYEVIGGIPHALSNFKMAVKKSVPLDGTSKVKLAARLVNEFTEKVYELINDHPINVSRKRRKLLPANTVICRDAGDKLPALPNISEKYGKKWAILADMPLEVGIGRLAGMPVVKLPLPTFTAADYKLRIKKIIAAMKKHDCLYIHLKGADLFGHDGDYKGKKKWIADCDKFFFSQLLKKINLKNTLLVVTADHATPCEMKGHSSDPVPLFVSGFGVKSDFVNKFGESSCKNGGLGRLKGSELIDKVMRFVK